MDAIGDFEDLLALLAKHKARYLIVGGLAVVYHAKPRYTKDMDIWVSGAADNVVRVNRALAEFGSPLLLAATGAERILQIGVAPNRIDIMQAIEGVRFETAWRNRVRDKYGHAQANWIGLDSLIRNKQHLSDPRHQEDVRVLRQVRNLRRGL